jgi:hypothetical protein
MHGSSPSGRSAALALLFLALPAAAQFQPAPGREYREFDNPVNPVRGEAVVGLAVAPTETAQQASVVQVFVPHPFSGEIHVETATANGRFRGEGVYSGSTKGKEWVSLRLTRSSPLNDKASLRPVSPTSLAIAARGPGGTLYLARWGEAPPSGSSELLRLYVNSRRADMFVRAGARVVRCAPMGIPQPVRFDTYCDLAMADVPKDGQVLLIRRDQFDEQTQAFKVYVP